MLNLNDFADKAYISAEVNGLWDEIEDYRIVSDLIHCEWSEALQEARAGRPLYYHVCSNNGECEQKDPCESPAMSRCSYKTGDGAESCPFWIPKPEGVAAELIDGIILICSTVRRYGGRFTAKNTADFKRMIPKMYEGFAADTPVTHLINALHIKTSESSVIMTLGKGIKEAVSPLERAIAMAWAWIEMQGIEPEALLMEKYEYNRTREYKHGKVF